jgi:excisionase family DNA binding protein
MLEAQARTEGAQMSTTVVDDRLVVFTTEQERQQARELRSTGEPDVLVDAHPMPPELHALFTQVLHAIAEGGTVTISTMPEELTTTVAARELGISRPTLMKMIRNGDIASHQVGTHHRLKSADVTRLKQDRITQRRDALSDLQRLSDELDF